MDVPIAAPPDSKNVAKGLDMGTQDNSANQKTLFATTDAAHKK